MAYNISDEKLLTLCVSDPSYCLFYHRPRLKELLPALAKSHMLVTQIEKMVEESLEEKQRSEGGT
jgi:hypothetical protein